MRFFITSTITHIKMIATPSFIITLLLFPLSLFVASFLGSSEAGKIKIGLVYEETPLVARVADQFQSYVGEDADFILFSDKEQMEIAVAKQAVECGYSISKDLKITLYKGPFTVSHEVFNLMLSSALIETMSGKLGTEVLKAYFPDVPNLAEEIQARADRYASEGPAMEINNVFLNEKGDFAEERAVDRMLHGLTALFAFLLSLLCAAAFSGNGMLLNRLRTVGFRPVFLYLLSQVFVTFLFLFIFLTLSLRASAASLILTASFCFALACFSLFLSMYIKKEVIAFIPFLFVITACLGQTLVNIEEVAAFLKPFTYLTFTSYYMAGITKALPWREAGLLALGAVLFTTLLLQHLNSFLNPC